MKDLSYAECVSKLAEEIIYGDVMEKEAADGEDNAVQDELASEVVSPEAKETIMKILAEKANDGAEAEEDEKDEEGDVSEEDKAAAIILNAIEKAAAVYRESEAIKQAAENANATAQLYKDAALSVLYDCGVLEK